MLMEQKHQDLICHVGSNLVLAQAGTGAETHVASIDYAGIHDWQITPYPDDKGFIVLANEEVIKVTGYVDTFLNIGEDKGPDTVPNPGRPL